MLYGFLLFAELPDLYTLLGASIIVASTLYIARREQLRNRQKQGGRRFGAGLRLLVAGALTEASASPRIRR